MKPFPKAAVTASFAGVLVFGVVFLVEYLRLLAHQPPNEPGQPWPADVTSFPPSAAWVAALPCGVITFVVVFVVALIVYDLQHRKLGALKVSVGWLFGEGS
jgi:hypothetical protein